jgi:hypothetical protein
MNLAILFILAPIIIFGVIIYHGLGRNRKLGSASTSTEFSKPKGSFIKYFVLFIIVFIGFAIFWKIYGSGDITTETHENTEKAGENIEKISQFIDPLRHYVNSGEFDSDYKNKMITIIDSCDLTLASIRVLISKIQRDDDIELEEAIIYNKELYSLMSKFDGLYGELKSENKLSAALEQFKTDFDQLKANNEIRADQLSKLSLRYSQDSVKAAHKVISLERELKDKSKKLSDLEMLLASNPNVTVSDLQEEIQNLKLDMEAITKARDEYFELIGQLRDSSETWQGKYAALLDDNTEQAAMIDVLKGAIRKRVDAKSLKIDGYKQRMGDKIPLSSIEDGFEVVFYSKFLDQSLSSKETVNINIDYIDKRGEPQSEDHRLDIFKDFNDENRLPVKLKETPGKGLITITVTLVIDGSFVNSYSEMIGVKNKK